MPFIEDGTLNVPENEPDESVVAVDMAVPLYFIVTVEDAEYPEPDTVTVLPILPNRGLIKADGLTVYV